MFVFQSQYVTSMAYLLPDLIQNLFFVDHLDEICQLFLKSDRVYSVWNPETEPKVSKALGAGGIHVVAKGWC